MFDNNVRYVTREITEALDIATQNLLWLLTDRMSAGSRDQLQFFELSVWEGQQKIVHTQEQAFYKKELLFSSPSPLTETVYIMKDGTRRIMFFAHESQKEEK